MTTATPYEVELGVKITQHSIGTAINALSRAHGDIKAAGDCHAVRELRVRIAQVMLELEHIDDELDTILKGASE